MDPQVNSSWTKPCMGPCTVYQEYTTMVPRVHDESCMFLSISKVTYDDENTRLRCIRQH